MKILWAFDPFIPNKELNKLGAFFLRKLADSNDSTEIVFIASNSETELATAFDIPIEKRFTDYPKKIILEQLEKLNIKKMSVLVLMVKSISLTTLVKKLVVCSKQKKIDLIVLPSNGKKLLPRFILGSFAETLIHLSICDLIIYHQNSKLDFSKSMSILYAHDFSEKGKAGLIKVIKYVKKWKAFLDIVYVTAPNVINKKTFNHRVEIEKILTREKIKFNIHVEFNYKPISQSILDLSEKNKNNIISVTASSNRPSILLGGSITRQILRESKLPTLVIKV